MNETLERTALTLGRRESRIEPLEVLRNSPRSRCKSAMRSSPTTVWLSKVTIANVREGYVHEFELPELKAKDGTLLWHRMAYYTVNKLRE